MNKFFLFFLAAAMTATTAMAQASICDTNYDGIINTADVVAIYNRIINGEEPQKPTPPTPKTYTVKGVSFKMVPVKAGTFMMGDDRLWDNEKPIHQVTLTNDYYIGQTEVTQALWEAVVGKENNNSNPKGPDYPVNCITWGHAGLFCLVLNSLLKDQLPEGMIFRFPTEAEWEYAARGGNMSRGYRYSGSDNAYEVAWCSELCISPREVREVGQRGANELGIYDMSGNVLEWCMDYSGSYPSGAQTDPTGPSTGEKKILRGGSFLEAPSSVIIGHYPTLTVANRNWADINESSALYGFRLVLGKSY